MKRNFTLSIILVPLILTACSSQNEQSNNKSHNSTASKDTSQQNQQSKYKKEMKDGRTYINGILIVNKKIPLPKEYNPGIDSNAQKALNKLFRDANQKELNFTKISDFRSYDTQVTLYNQYVDRDGRKAADKYSARPGHSEHQTGLTFDVGVAGPQSETNLKESFGNTKEGRWLAQHAHQYGFIIRYPKGKTNITGYQYEPWHIRYLGKEKATQIYKSGQTLEEYLNLEP